MKLARLSVFALAMLSACASVSERSQRDLASVTAEVRERTGFEIDEADAATARALLERAIGPDQAVLAALALDPHVRERIAELGVASAQRVRAGLVRNPLLQLGISSSSDGTDIDLDLIQPLAELLLLDARRDIADAELDAARARTARELLRSVYDVRRAWVDAAADERALAVANERLVAEEAAARLARELHAAGNVTDAVLTRSESALAEARGERARAQGRATESLERLARRVGSPGAALVLDARAWAAAAPELTAEELANIAEAASLDLRERRAEAAALARAAGVSSWSARLERGAVGVTARREDGVRGVGPTLAVPLPLFDDGSAAHSIAESELDVSLERYRGARLDVRAAAHGLEARRKAAAEAARIARDERRPLARRLLHETLRQYNAMQIGVFDVLESRRRELDAERDALERERDARRAHLDLEELLAGSLPELSELTRNSIAATPEEN